MSVKPEGKKDQMDDTDRLSNLPWDVLDSILVHIPLKEVVRTSVLSTKWRYKWARLSRIVIDDKVFPGASDAELRWEVVEKILGQVRLRNTGGPIEKFKLAAYCHPDHPFLLRWVTFLFGKGLKEFVLMPFSSPTRFKLPLHALSCRKLTSLELFGCSLDIPRDSAFEGFGSLTSLTLNSVFINAWSLECLVSKCPNLESLTLLNLDFSIALRLNGTKLKCLKISSVFDDICLLDNPFLESVDIRLRDRVFHFVRNEASNLVRVIGYLQGVKRLALTNEVLEFLAEPNVPDRLPLLENLRILELKNVIAHNLNHVKVSLCLLWSAPSLEELHISVDEPFSSWKSVVDFVKAQSPFGLYFNRLKVFKFRGVRNIILALHFFKLVLANSPVLETMTIICFGTEKIPVEQINQFERASDRVKILIL